MTDVHMRVLPAPFVRPWKCDACGKTIGEIVSGVVVIRHGDRVIRWPLKEWAEQQCPKCKAMCRLEAA